MQTQTIEIQPVIRFEIPDDKILIDRVSYQTLEADALKGKTWSVKEITARLGGKDPKDWKIVFYKHRSSVDVMCGGFVKFPAVNENGETKGSRWKFQASKTAEFIEQHWREFMEAKDIYGK